MDSQVRAWERLCDRRTSWRSRAVYPSMSFVDAGAKRIGVKPQMGIPFTGYRFAHSSPEGKIGYISTRLARDDRGKWKFSPMNIFERVMKTLHRARGWNDRLKQLAVPHRSRHAGGRTAPTKRCSDCRHPRIAARARSACRLNPGERRRARPARQKPVFSMVRRGASSGTLPLHGTRRSGRGPLLHARRPAHVRTKSHGDAPTEHRDCYQYRAGQCDSCDRRVGAGADARRRVAARPGSRSSTCRC